MQIIFVVLLHYPLQLNTSARSYEPTEDYHLNQQLSSAL